MHDEEALFGQVVARLLVESRNARDGFHDNRSRLRKPMTNKIGNAFDSRSAVARTCRDANLCPGRATTATAPRRSMPKPPVPNSG
ncbi:hypothetical protein BST30_18130 [Mycobacterium mantenii]|uniref:Uncharacterized protein n=1 Tax=Mycobacterium mantenii TaxID=560555 RepID=A0A1X0FNV8_MYCNT|nr:hypothetical protein BST30_18130 [Mycobacterium mantenii]